MLHRFDLHVQSLVWQELKSFRVQVPGLQGKKSADPVVLNLSTVHMKNAGASLLGTQVVHFKSLSGSGSPLVVNASSLESPIQILVRQTQLSAAKPRTPDPNKNTSESLEEHRSCVAHPQNGARASCTGDPVQKKGHKRKKPIKIKTRSGRISRPPKHKAKDYKFLKVGDMIQGSTSDSEDFSELSTDEDEKGAKEMTPCELPPCPVRNALFQCQTCEKSYMGKGGLSRHYRLYPSHGQMEAQFVSDAKKKGESGVGGHSLPSEPKVRNLIGKSGAVYIRGRRPERTATTTPPYGCQWPHEFAWDAGKLMQQLMDAWGGMVASSRSGLLTLKLCFTICHNCLVITKGHPKKVRGTNESL